MDREVTVGGSTWIVQPDQVQMLNSLFVLVLIPTFDRVIYPLLRRMGLSMRPVRPRGPRSPRFLSPRGSRSESREAPRVGEPHSSNAWALAWF